MILEDFKSQLFVKIETFPPMTQTQIKDLEVCELLPVLRSSLETDTMPVSTVALPLSLVLLPYIAGQLSSHHHAITLLQDSTDWHHLCCWKILSQVYRLRWVLLISLKIWWWSCLFKETVMLQLAVSPGFQCLSLSLFVPSMSGLGFVHDFYRRSVAISDLCCHSTISVHWHPTPSVPRLIPGSWKPLWEGGMGNWAENPLILKLYAQSPPWSLSPNTFRFSRDCGVLAERVSWGLSLWRLYKHVDRHTQQV